MAWSHFLYCFSLITTCITHAGGWVLGLLVVFVKNTIHLRLFFSSLLCHTFWSHNLSIFSTRTALIGFDHDGRSFHITFTGKVALRFVFSVIRCSLAAFCRTACIWEGWWGPVYVASPLVYSGVLMFKPRLCCDVGATENLLHHPPLQQAHIYQMRHSSWESHKKKSRVAEQLWSCLLCFLSLFFHFLSLSVALSLLLMFTCGSLCFVLILLQTSTHLFQVQWLSDQCAVVYSTVWCWRSLSWCLDTPLLTDLVFHAS